jgi:hypothetical protein
VETRSRQITGCSTGDFMAVRSYILAGIMVYLFLPLVATAAVLFANA